MLLETRCYQVGSDGGSAIADAVFQTPCLLMDAPSVGCVQEPDGSRKLLKSARNYTGGNAPRSNYIDSKKRE